MIDSPRFYLDKSKKSVPNERVKRLTNGFRRRVLNVEFDFRLYLKNRQQRRKERERKIGKRNFAAKTKALFSCEGRQPGSVSHSQTAVINRKSADLPISPFRFITAYKKNEMREYTI